MEEILVPQEYNERQLLARHQKTSPSELRPTHTYIRMSNVVLNKIYRQQSHQHPKCYAEVTITSDKKGQDKN